MEEAARVLVMVDIRVLEVGIRAGKGEDIKVQAVLGIVPNRQIAIPVRELVIVAQLHQEAGRTVEEVDLKAVEEGTLTMEVILTMEKVVVVVVEKLQIVQWMGVLGKTKEVVSVTGQVTIEETEEVEAVEVVDLVEAEGVIVVVVVCMEVLMNSVIRLVLIAHSVEGLETREIAEDMEIVEGVEDIIGMVFLLLWDPELTHR